MKKILDYILGLYNLLDGLFLILMAYNEEPILIIEETSFKTYLTQLSFKDNKNSYESCFFKSRIYKSIIIRFIFIFHTWRCKKVLS